MKRLKERVALITGAGGDLGGAAAVRFGEEGAKVIVHDHLKMEQAGQVVERIRSLGSEAIALQGDIIHLEEARRVVREGLGAFGRIDILVNVVGGARNALIHEMPEEVWDYVINLNLKTSFNCVRAVVPHMIGNRYGRIVNTSSLAKNGVPWYVYSREGRTNYASANAALVGFTRSLALELAEYNVTVNCIVPGPIETPRTARAFRALEEDPEVKVSPLKLIPLRRLGRPRDVANAILFFASDEAEYITGEELYITGGLR
ncbi:MAG: SDR family NAD(P)-dependent oxidoreductase [Nitrospinota bacterium]